MLELFAMGRPDSRVSQDMRKVRAPKGKDAVITSGVGNYRESATETFRRNG
jgi:hypothetical protein